MEKEFDFIIVGGGCIALSTAFAIKRKWPDARVLLFKGIHEHTASNDITKIIRDAYPEKIMAEYANRAMQEWTTDPYRHYFHRTGWIQAIDRNTGKIMNKEQNDKMITTEEMMSLVGSTIAPTLNATEELYLNPKIGYADSDVALQAVCDEVVKLGVERRDENVTRLVTEAGICIGVEVGGFIVKAGKTIVSAGAWTPGLLEKSKIPVRPGFFQVSAVGVAIVELTDAEFDSLKSMPILVTENGKHSQRKFEHH
jgi:sarcosine oxidase/L-pipecolate oxidase